MNKITQYLNEHLLGEVSSSDPVRNYFSRDSSVLSIKPEIVAHPRVTNDVRKVARFSWQLAEQGHALSITTRGGGTDQTGGAIGKGIVINTLAHLNKILFISLKNKDQFIHTQPGVVINTANEALKANGLYIPTDVQNPGHVTVGGAIANNLGKIGDLVTRLEVVLANGDLIETSRISRHDLNKKKGLQTFEGDIYRKIDGILEDNQEVIEKKIASNIDDNTGYSGIAKVKNRDGSFDLTPLLAGSQGTLGFISEAVLRTSFYSPEDTIIVGIFESSETARDAADEIMKLEPSHLELLDSGLFEMAKAQGEKFLFSEEVLDRSFASVMYVSFREFSDHAKKHKLKRTLKTLAKYNVNVYSTENHEIDEFYPIAEVQSLLAMSTDKKQTQPPIIDGASVPLERREEFMVALRELAEKHHTSLPARINWLTGAVYTRPALDLHTVSDKQKCLRLINDHMELVTRFGGCMCADSGEGRLKADAAYAQIDADELSIYEQIRAAFDPYNMMNTGVKQKSDLKTLASELDSDYSPI